MVFNFCGATENVYFIADSCFKLRLKNYFVCKFVFWGATVVEFLLQINFWRTYRYGHLLLSFLRSYCNGQCRCNFGRHWCRIYFLSLFVGQGRATCHGKIVYSPRKLYKIIVHIEDQLAMEKKNLLTSPAGTNFTRQNLTDPGGSGRKILAIICVLILRRKKKETLRYHIRELYWLIFLFLEHYIPECDSEGFFLLYTEYKRSDLR